MTEATRPDPEDQPVVLVVDEVQDLWDRVEMDLRLAHLFRAAPLAVRNEFRHLVLGPAADSDECPCGLPGPGRCQTSTLAIDRVHGALERWRPAPVVLALVVAFLAGRRTRGGHR